MNFGILHRHYYLTAMFSNPWKRSIQSKIWDQIVDGTEYRENPWISPDDWLIHSDKLRHKWLKEFEEEYEYQPLAERNWNNWWQWIADHAKEQAHLKREYARKDWNVSMRVKDPNYMARIDYEKQRRKLQKKMYGDFMKFKVPYKGKRPKLIRQNATVAPLKTIARGFARTWKSPYEVEKAKRLQAARIKQFHWKGVNLF